MSEVSSLRVSAARFLDRSIFYSLLALILLVSIPYGTVEAWWEALFEVIVFALGALWVVESTLSGDWLRRSHALFLPLLLLSLYAFIQSLPIGSSISADPYQTRLVALRLLALTLAGALLLRYTSGSSRLRALVFTIIAVALASALFGILRQTTQREAAGFLLPALKPGGGYAQFINKNHFAFLMEMALGLTLGLAVGAGLRRQLWLTYLALALPLWAALILCGSRGGILSVFAQVAFAGLLFTFARPAREGREEGRKSTHTSPRRGRTLAARIALVVCLLVACFVGAIWIGGDPLVERLESVPGEVHSQADPARVGVGRKEIWRATWRLIKENPVVGVGFGGYWIAITRYHDASGEMVPQEAHNDYLELLASGGLVALALAAWFLVALIRRAGRTLRSTDSLRRAACFGALVGLFGVAVHSVVDFGLHITINALVLMALVAIIAGGGQEGSEGARSGRPSGA